MRFIPILIFFIYVYLEVSFFMVIANHIGVFLALLGIIATSMIGLSLVKSQGVQNFIAMQQKIANNENPTPEIVRGTSLLMAGFFLLVPGFLTDIIGAILLLPFMQKWVARFIVPKMNITTYSSRGNSTFHINNNRLSDNSSHDDNIIEGEFKRKDDE
ncbi:FxsA family protein [Orbaceae bacterium ESL0727]|nr:FxsA family protein [Orbaceae bacterium ESL0727]